MMRAIPLWGLVLAVAVLLSGCTTGRTLPATTPAASASFLEALSAQVAGLQSRAAQGDRPAEAAIRALLDGHGVEVLMAQRTGQAGQDAPPHARDTERTAE